MKKTFAIMLSFIAVTLACAMAVSEKNAGVEVRVVEMIIKVKPEVIVMPEGVYSGPLGDMEINSRGLKELNVKFNLISVEKMFAAKKSKEEAPQGSEEGGLEDTYLFRFPEHTDVRVLIEEYGSVEDVVYIEENQVVSIFYN